MRVRDTLKRRISRTFLLQAAAISIAAVISVWLAATVIKHVLVTEALRLEAEYFWQRRDLDEGFPLPETRNLSGFLAPVGVDAGLPEGLQGVVDGYHEVPSGADFTTVYASTRDGQRLYLVFDGERVNELAAYFGLVPLVVVLLVLYLSVWLAFRASNRAVSPISWLAREVDRLEPETPGAARFDPGRLPPDADQEVQVLASALDGLARRLDAFVERERTFTRDASHELRTPLTVIRVATDVLLARDDLDGQVRDGVERIRRSSDEMERLVEAFLMLAREDAQGPPDEAVCVNETVAAEVARLQLISTGKPVDCTVEADCLLRVQAPVEAVAAVVGNLLRNAFAYTEAGRITVSIREREVVIADSGVGMNPQQVRDAVAGRTRGGGRPGRHGVGLTIVRRFADRFGWTVEIDSTPNVGTRARVAFPHGRCEPIRPDLVREPA